MNGQLSQFFLSGLANGAIYGLIGFGFAIIYNATGIINFAQGEFVMLGGMMSVFFLSAFSLPLPVCVVLAIGATMITGLLLDYLAIKPLKNATPSPSSSLPSGRASSSAEWLCSFGGKTPMPSPPSRVRRQ